MGSGNTNTSTLQFGYSIGKVSIGIQTVGHLSGAEISLEEPLRVRWFGRLNYFGSCVNPSLEKEK